MTRPHFSPRDDSDGWAYDCRCIIERFSPQERFLYEAMFGNGTRREFTRDVRRERVKEIEVPS